MTESERLKLTKEWLPKLLKAGFDNPLTIIAETFQTIKEREVSRRLLDGMR